MAVMRLFGLRARLVLLVLLALAPVFVVVVSDVVGRQNEALESARARLVGQAQLIAAAEERMLDKTHNLLVAVGNAPAIREASPVNCTTYFRNLLIQYPMYTSIGLVSPDGTLICSDSGARRPIHEQAQPALQQFMAVQGFMMGGYERHPRTGREQVLFGAPVHGPEGQLQAVVYASLGLDSIANALISIPRVEDAQALVMDRTGTVLAAYPPRPGVVGARMDEPVVQRMRQAPGGGQLQAADRQGVMREWAFSRVKDASGTSFFIAVSVPRDLVIAPARADFFWQLAVLLLTALLGAGAAWWAGERLVLAPARALLGRANQIAGGDLAARVGIEDGQPVEIARLGQAFNDMAQALQARRAELDDMLRSIEKEHALLDLIIHNMSEGVVAADTSGRLLLINEAARRHLGVERPLHDVEGLNEGHELHEPGDGVIIPADRRPLARALRGESLDHWEAELFRSDGSRRIVHASARPLRDRAGALLGGLVVFTDVTERRIAEDFERGQERVLELIASGAPLPQSLEAVAHMIERRLPGGRCSVLLHHDGELWHAAAPSLPEAFNRLVHGLPVAEGSGVCGTAAHRREPVVVRDIGAEPMLVEWREVASKFGLAACWSTPILNAAREVLGTFAIYHDGVFEPAPGDAALVDVATRLARLAIERARAEEALRDGEARFRELAENIHDVFYSYDPVTRRILYISPAYEALWGRSCESLMDDPASFVAAVHPDDRDHVIASRAENGARGSDLEYRVMRPDGGIRWVHDHSYPVFGAAGAPDRVVGTVRDITARKQADLDLVHTNRALQMLSRGNEALVRAEDEQQLLLEICRLAVNVGGYQMAWVGYAEDDVARSIRPQAWAGQEQGYLSEVSLTWAENDPRGLGPGGRAIRGGHVVICEDILSESSGFHWRAQAFERGYRSLICLPLHDGQRTFGMLALFAPTVLKTRWEEVKLLQELSANLAYGIGSLRARAEQRRIEQAMRSANERLVEQASLLDRAQDAIIVRSIEHNLVRYWNKGAERLYGWTAAEAIGQPMWNRMYEDRSQFDAALAALLAQGEWSGELVQRDRAGNELVVEGRWTLVRDAEGRPASVLAINTDIRERRRARDQILRLNAELEERVQRRTAQLLAANKELEAFSYSVSHDLRTPLNSIDGFSHLLERAQSHSADDKQRHYLARIRNGVRQMSELIEGLLLLSQISRASMKDEDVDLSAMARQALASWREREPARNVDVHVADGLIAHGDPRLLRQVVENLVGNAWKFTSQQAQARISVDAETSPEGRRVYFVRDNGAGFDMAHAGKLFGAFQRMHAVTDYPGTGIGLATVQRIIKRHGGSIWAEAAPGLGATFYFTLGRAEGLNAG
jgi:PAS domain S-box-containing protein